MAILIVAIQSSLAVPSDTDATPKRHWGKTFGGGLAMSIATDKSTYAPGERVILDLLLRNVGESDVNVSSLDMFLGFRIIVSLPDGKTVPYSRWGKQRRTSANEREGSRFGAPFAPGQQLECKINLSRLFDFTEEGKYRIVVNRTSIVAQLAHKPPAGTSNVIEIEIAERTSGREMQEDFGHWTYPSGGFGGRGSRGRQREVMER
jgi:hypothetical protein